MASPFPTAGLPPHELPPLAGIRVVDFGCYVAGPLVGRILADAGATVEAVTPPDGPLWKSECSKLLSRGKTVVVSPVSLRKVAVCSTSSILARVLARPPGRLVTSLRVGYGTGDGTTRGQRIASVIF